MKTENTMTYGVRRGVSAAVVVVSMIVCLLLTGGVYLVFAGRGKSDVISPILTTVKSGEFVAQVLDQGEIQSSENIEIRCRVRARNGTVNVIEVVPEGTRVSSGDFLVRLDATSFEKELEQQKIAVANAQTAVIQANAAWKAAEAAKKEYIEGVFVEQKKTIENQIYEAKAAIETARQEHTQAVAALHHSEVMQSKGFITFQQLAADKFAVEKALVNLQKAENSLQLANKKLEVLENITREKELVRLTSDIEAAYVKLKNSEESLKVEEDRLADINQQIANCYVVVPPGVEGQVVYGKESSRGGTDWVLEEGAAVRENQVLMRLPNPKKMEVKALINEQSITSIRVGMPATIKVDALNNQTLKGVVTKVNQYAEQSSWGMSTQIRKYAVFVRIFDPPEELKPGMNASVSIQVQYEPDAIMVPLQAVYGVGDEKYCLVKTPSNQWETRKIVGGGDNALMLLVREGLQPNEQVVLNPGAYKEYMNLPPVAAEKPIELPADAADVAVNAESPRPAAAEDGSRDRREREANEGRPSGRDGGGAFAGGMDPEALVQMSMDRFDLNGDGQLDSSELASIDGRMRDRMRQADVDGDEILSRDELLESTRRMMEQMQRNGGPRGGGGRGVGPPSVNAN